VLAAQEQRTKLHPQAAGLCNTDGRHATFAQLSQLLLEAFEEICLVSEALREDCQALRSHAEEVCECSQQILDRPRSFGELSSRFAAQSPEEGQQAESLRLDIFKDGISPREQP
jgi:hypothetical protein